MRAERPSPQPRPARSPEPPFSQVMARLKARAAAHAATAAELRKARAAQAVEGERPTAARAEAREPGEQRPDERALELVARALKREEPRPEPGPAPGAGPAEARPPSRAEAALRLVERIEVFLRSGQARLELSVGGGLQWAVLLERTGPGQVAVTLRGRRGAPSPGELARVREQLRARGLKLSALTLAPGT